MVKLVKIHTLGHPSPYRCYNILVVTIKVLKKQGTSEN